MILVILESPYAGDVERNVAYARACMRDCLLRGEAPIASHLLYTQPGVLDDLAPNERALGIRAGLAWGRVAEATVVYTDLGITAGMQEGIGRAHAEGRVVYTRELKGWTWLPPGHAVDNFGNIYPTAAGGARIKTMAEIKAMGRSEKP